MAGRPTEIAELTGTQQQTRDWVRTNFPQCLEINPDTGEETGNIVSAYTRETAIEYVPRLVKDNDDANPVFGGEGLIIEWHVEPESTDQNDRIQARGQMILARLKNIPNKDRETLDRSLKYLNIIPAEGIDYVVLPWYQWAGRLPPETVGRAIRAIEAKIPPGPDKVDMGRSAVIVERELEVRSR